MASGDEWNPKKMLDRYLHDYMIKNHMHQTAEIFRKEAEVTNIPLAIDTPDGFLAEWWSIFYDTYASRQLKQPEPTQMMHSELQNAHLQASQSLIPGQTFMGSEFENVMGQPGIGLFAAKLYEEEHLRGPSNTMDHPKYAANSFSHLQQQYSNQSQQRIVRENRPGISLGRSIPVDPNLFGVPKAIPPRTGQRGAGSKGVNPMPLKRWPLTRDDQFSPGFEYQVPNSLLHQQQFQMSTAPHQQEIFSHVLSSTPETLVSTFPGSSSNVDTCNSILPGSDLTGKNRGMIIHMQQQQHHDHHQQQQQQKLYEIDRKKNIISAGPSTSDYGSVDENRHINENVESFFSHDDDDDDDADITSSRFSILKRRSTPFNKNEHKGFSFEEVGCFHSSKSKVLCCHFSSDGKLLASAGHDKKVSIWNMETLESFKTSEENSQLISDVRFRTNSTVFATSSFDKTVQIWDAARPNKSQFTLLGHGEQVTSLDFHPRKADLLCSCDRNEEIRLWNVNQRACIHTSKGATRQIRFQPRAGKLLATVSGNDISIIDVETDSLQFYLKGHTKEVRTICWDTSGKYIASVSEDSVRVWSVANGGKCIHELLSNGNNYQSCTFHPGYSQLLVIGGYECIELWNPTESNNTLTVQAHSGIISALADSPQTEVIASASHDQSVKLWK